MAKSNAFLDKQKKLQQAHLDAGMDMGFQKCWDLVCICLHDPQVMGKDIFGKTRLVRLYNALMEYERDLGKALLPDTEKEADAKQRDMDALLTEIWGDTLCPFNERYPYIPKTDYSKGKKEWRK